MVSVLLVLAYFTDSSCVSLADFKPVIADRLDMPLLYLNFLNIGVNSLFSESSRSRSRSRSSSSSSNKNNNNNNNNNNNKNNNNNNNNNNNGFIEKVLSENCLKNALLSKFFPNFERHFKRS